MLLNDEFFNLYQTKKFILTYIQNVPKLMAHSVCYEFYLFRFISFAAERACTQVDSQNYNPHII